MNRNHHKKGISAKHGLLMLLCCLIPIIAIAVVRLFDVPLNNVLYVGLLLLCPVSHVLMMGGMTRHDQGSARESNVLEGEVISRRSEPVE
jgi:uncharacterized membrane protein YhaH (DUF805 family)